MCFLGVLAGLGLNYYVDELTRQTDELEAPGPHLAESCQINRLHQSKLPPGRDDWLALNDEFGQSFGRYLTSRPNSPTDVRTTLYVQPIGEFDEKHVELSSNTAEFLSRYFDMPTEVLQPITLSDVPSAAHRQHQGNTQLLTYYLLDDILKPARPSDAVAVLGLTHFDLWPGDGWSFVFGQANTPERVGVWSLHRFGDPDGSQSEWQTYRKRTFKVALHETGHMLGINHCTFYECLMNGSNHLAEMDSRPLWSCPECVRKVWWNCESDPVKRYKRLADFGASMQLHDEAAFWQQSMSVIDSQR